jgi:hypothetical protein
MFPQWLRSKATVAELDAEHLVNGKPFGFCNNDEWEPLKAKMLPGDEVWRFSSPPEDWEATMGRKGVALVRDGEIVECLVTAMN